jgi:endoglucanase
LLAVKGSAAVLATLGWAGQAAAGDLIVNGDFVAEDFNAAAGWLGIDDKYGTASQAHDMAVWSDTAPNYGAILRICQDAAALVGGNAGAVWGAHIEQTLPLQADHTYTLSFWAADLPLNEYDPACSEFTGPSHALQVQVVGQSSGELLSQAVSVAGCGSTCGSSHEVQFVAPANDTAVLKFFFGGQWAKLKLAGVRLDDAAPAPVDPGSGASSGVSVNGLGYLPAGPKLATLHSISAGALPWELREAGGAMLASGMTQPFGADALSGDTLQRIDFGSFAGNGSALRLVVDGVTSAPFAVAGDVYGGLARDSLRFYYYQRCGQPLTEPQVESSALARASDHGADASASCSAGQSCGPGYPLDVSRGWHDAGDYGKYVVTGAVSVWTLLNLYERAALWGAPASRFGDGQLNTAPSNGSPDLLDEARHELEFLLGMQVPEGNPLAGMAHHKLHADTWVPMPTHPEDDASTRFLRPPSTASTLDLAAVAAQCARVWRDLDAAFAARCQNAAERAWSAARTHPDLFAPGDSNVGGGPYDDSYVGDEFYWAAAELFLSTGRPEYGDYLRSSSHFAGFSAGGAPLSWPGTAGFGTISLALAPSTLSAAELARVRHGIVEQADLCLSREAQNGYGVPLDQVIWGSNGDTLNAGMVLALAYDITGEARYFGGAASALDYVLGKNPLGRSYVTGYGSNPVSKIHHTNFAPYLDASFPAPPPGFLVGGPNHDLAAFADPGVSPDCSPLRCWSEASGAYWFIEVAINWNAPLVWLSSWLDERGQASAHAPIGVGDAPGTGGAAAGTGTGGATGSSSGGMSGVDSNGSEPTLFGTTALDASDPDAASNDAAGSAGCGCRLSSDRSNAGGLALGAWLALACARRRRRSAV